MKRPASPAGSGRRFRRASLGDFLCKADDLDKTIAKAKSLGGKVVMPPTQIPGGPAIAAFEDPEGHVIGLVKEEAA